MGIVEFLPDNDIIDGCIRGERKYQKALYDKFSGKMFAVCLRYSADSNKAEDMMQDGFIKVFRNIEKFRREGSFEGWIRRIFVNSCIENLRKKTTLYAIQETTIANVEYNETNAFENLKADDLLKMISELATGYRTVFNLYAIEGYSHKEIGEMLNISEGTSKSQLARARYLLQQKLAETSKSLLSVAK